MISFINVVAKFKYDAWFCALKFQFHQNESNKFLFLQDTKITMVDRCLQIALGGFKFKNTWTSFIFEILQNSPQPIAHSPQQEIYCLVLCKKWGSSRNQLFVYIYFGSVSPETEWNWLVLVSDFFRIKNETGWWFHDFRGIKLWNLIYYQKQAKNSSFYTKKSVFFMKL